jgi:hypothetical protein
MIGRSTVPAANGDAMENAADADPLEPRATARLGRTTGTAARGAVGATRGSVMSHHDIADGHAIGAVRPVEIDTVAQSIPVGSTARTGLAPPAGTEAADIVAVAGLLVWRNNTTVTADLARATAVNANGTAIVGSADLHHMPSHHDGRIGSGTAERAGPTAVRIAARTLAAIEMITVVAARTAKATHVEIYRWFHQAQVLHRLGLVELQAVLDIQSSWDAILGPPPLHPSAGPSGSLESYAN